MNEQNDDTQVTVREAAAALRVCTATVRRFADEGVLAAVKVGRQWRIPRSEIRRVLSPSPR